MKLIKSISELMYLYHLPWFNVRTTLINEDVIAIKLHRKVDRNETIYGFTKVNTISLTLQIWHMRWDIVRKKCISSQLLYKSCGKKIIFFFEKIIKLLGVIIFPLKQHHGYTKIKWFQFAPVSLFHSYYKSSIVATGIDFSEEKNIIIVYDKMKH